MHNIAENGIITLTAGDSLIAPLFITYLDENDKETLYTLSEYDTVYFSLMLPNQPFEHGVVRKIYRYQDTDKNGNVIVYLSTEDTENLPKGTYYYSIKFLTIRDNREFVDTVVPKRKFFII
jgi:hypothetical protein